MNGQPEMSSVPSSPRSSEVSWEAHSFVAHFILAQLASVNDLGAHIEAALSECRLHVVIIQFAFPLVPEEGLDQ